MYIKELIVKKEKKFLEKAIESFPKCSFYVHPTLTSYIQKKS